GWCNQININIVLIKDRVESLFKEYFPGNLLSFSCKR
ncbi:unnamed protein product, partial [marine sediment metagenome]